MSTARHPIPADVRRELAILAHRFRRTVNGPAWDVPGIEAAIDQCGAPPCEIAAALFALAADPTMRTPGLLRHPGKHWPIIGTERAEPARTYTMRCHEHPDQDVPCRTCRADLDAQPPARPETIAAARAALRDSIDAAAARERQIQAARTRATIGGER